MGVEAFPQVYSTDGWADTIELGGVFSDSPDNAMADYNKIFYGYCSGDSHISSKDNLGGQAQFFDKYYMNGYGNTYALFDKLAKEYGFGAHVAGEDLVIGGEGAGALGAMFALELDDMPFMQLLQDQVGRYGTNGGQLAEIKIMGLFDSPLELDEAPYQNSEYSAGLADRVQRLTELLQIGEQVDQACLQGEGDAWKCVFGEFFLKYQTYPYVMLADLYDTRQLTAQLGYSYGSTFNWHSLSDD